MLRTFQMALVFTYSLYVTTNFFQDIFNHIALKYYSAIYQSSEEKNDIPQTFTNISSICQFLFQKLGLPLNKLLLYSLYLDFIMILHFLLIQSMVYGLPKCIKAS